MLDILGSARTHFEYLFEIALSFKMLSHTCMHDFRPNIVKTIRNALLEASQLAQSVFVVLHGQFLQISVHASDDYKEFISGAGPSLQFSSY